MISIKFSFSFQLLVTALFARSSWNGTLAGLWAFPKHSLSYLNPVFPASSSVFGWYCSINMGWVKEYRRIYTKDKSCDKSDERGQASWLQFLVLEKMLSYAKFREGLCGGCCHSCQILGVYQSMRKSIQQIQ